MLEENGNFDVFKKAFHDIALSDLGIIAISLFIGAIVMILIYFFALAINIVVRGKTPDQW